ncbi:MAG: hypothetical protein ABI767_06665 [Rhodanobacter sp.]
MNEFEWRRQLRELRQPQMPQRDLWPSIDAALTGAEHVHESSKDAPAHPRRRRRARWLIGTAIAASLLLAGNSTWRVIRAPIADPTTTVAPATTSWKPSDPRLVGAAIELNAAQMELKLAMEQAPDSPALQRLLDRTETQQTHLRQLANQAG